MIIKAVFENVSMIITSFVISHLYIERKNKNFKWFKLLYKGWQE